MDRFIENFLIYVAGRTYQTQRSYTLWGNFRIPMLRKFLVSLLFTYQTSLSLSNGPNKKNVIYVAGRIHRYHDNVSDIHIFHRRNNGKSLDN
jgi:hypothetical protein